MWSPRLVPGFAPDGTPILSVLGKRTYRFLPGKTAQLDREKPVPIFEVDEFFGEGDPETDAPKQENDLVAWKPLVDVVVHGMAHAPKGNMARHFDLNVEVAGARRALRVFGDRKVDLSAGGIRFSDPVLFSSMPLHWGLAYGGQDLTSHPEIPLAYPRNPVGRGFAVDPPPAMLHGLVLPNLENPQALLDPDTFLVKKFERWNKAPTPMALGWMPRHSFPRLLQGGMDPVTTDEAAKTRARVAANMPLALLEIPAPAPGKPLNHLQNNGAPSFLRFPTLAGNEPVALGFMDPDHPRFEFHLPDDVPRGYLDLGEGMVELPMTLATVEIYKPTNQVTLLWRGSARYPGADWLASCSTLQFHVEF